MEGLRAPGSPGGLPRTNQRPASARATQLQNARLLYEMSEQVLLRCTEAWNAACAADVQGSPRLRRVQDAAFSGLSAAKGLRDAAWEACDQLLRERHSEALTTRDGLFATASGPDAAGSAAGAGGNAGGRWTAAFTS